jgi:hypothetical protein
LVTLIGVTSKDYTMDLVVDFALWQFDGVQDLEVWQLSAGGEKTLLDTLHGPRAVLPVTTKARSAVLLQLSPVA